MRRVTVDDIMAKKPCNEYPREQVEALWGSRESLTLTEVLDLDIPAKDRVWAVTRFLSKEEKRYFARWCALQVIHLWNCPDVVKQYLETGDEGLRDAAWYAAWNAAWNAASDAAWYAARSVGNAAWSTRFAVKEAASDAADAASDAASDARDATKKAAHDAHDAWDAEQKEQVDELRRMIKCTK